VKSIDEIIDKLDLISAYLYNKFGTDSYTVRREIHDAKTELSKHRYFERQENLKKEKEENEKKD